MENKYISIKVVAYAIKDFLHALINNGVSEEKIFITKEDNYLVVRLPMNELSSYKNKNYGELVNIEVEEDEQTK